MGAENRDERDDDAEATRSMKTVRKMMRTDGRRFMGGTRITFRESLWVVGSESSGAVTIYDL